MSRESKTINIEVGSRIRARRQELGLTRDALAEKVLYSSNFIQEVERGRSGLSSESLKAFSMALNISADVLLFGNASHSFDFLSLKLDQVPEEKLDHILKILDEAIQCTL